MTTGITTTIITAAVTFAATNVDDLVILTLFFSQTGRTFHRWHVVVGQYLGFSALVAISLLGYLTGLLIPQKVIGLLGFIPIFIGLRHWRHLTLSASLSEVDSDWQLTIGWLQQPVVR